MAKPDGVDAYPLCWPVGWQRTQRRTKARFNGTFGVVRSELMHEVHKLGGRYPTLSTNLPLRRDGLPYANVTEPADPGVAIYFERGNRSMVFACDKWNRVRDNVRSIQKTIAAIRGIERWGASDMMERAFQAFEAIAAPKTCWAVLGIDPTVSIDVIGAAYKLKARIHHPDAGGSTAAMAEINRARNEAIEFAAKQRIAA